MTKFGSRYRKILAHRARRAILVVAMVLGTFAVSTGAASADTSKCPPPTGYATCFELTERSVDYVVYVGIDIYMTRQQAEDLISPPGEEFSAKVWGIDPVWDNALFNLPVIRSWASDGGLSAEFQLTVTKNWLDEDWDGEDELQGRVRLYDHRNNRYLEYRTGVIHETIHRYP